MIGLKITELAYKLTNNNKWPEKASIALVCLATHIDVAYVSPRKLACISTKICPEVNCGPECAPTY